MTETSALRLLAASICVALALIYGTVVLARSCHCPQANTTEMRP